MLPRSQFEEFSEVLVTRFFPGEASAFQLAKGRFVEQLYDPSELAKRRVERGEFQFVPDGKTILEFVAVLSATYKFLKEGWADWQKAHSKEKEAKAIFERWRYKLIASGVSRGKAEEITDALKIEIAQLVQKNANATDSK